MTLRDKACPCLPQNALCKLDGRNFFQPAALLFAAVAPRATPSRASHPHKKKQQTATFAATTPYLSVHHPMVLRSKHLYSQIPQQRDRPRHHPSLRKGASTASVGNIAAGHHFAPGSTSTLLALRIKQHGALRISVDVVFFACPHGLQ